MSGESLAVKLIRVDNSWIESEPFVFLPAFLPLTWELFQEGESKKHLQISRRPISRVAVELRYSWAWSGAGSKPEEGTGSQKMVNFNPLWSDSWITPAEFWKNAGAGWLRFSFRPPVGAHQRHSLISLVHFFMGEFGVSLGCGRKGIRSDRSICHIAWGLCVMSGCPKETQACRRNSNKQMTEFIAQPVSVVYGKNRDPVLCFRTGDLILPCFITPWASFTKLCWGCWMLCRNLWTGTLA